MKLYQQTVLVLNRNWLAIGTTTPAEAFAHLVRESARGLLLDRDQGMRTVGWDLWARLPVRSSDEVISTPSRVVRIPTVIVLNTYNQVHDGHHPQQRGGSVSRRVPATYLIQNTYHIADWEYFLPS